MPVYKTKVCPKCKQEKKSYMFDPLDEGLCIVCAKRDILAKKVRKKGPRPKPGSFWRSIVERATRKQVLEVVEEDGEEIVRFRPLEGFYEGKIRTSKLKNFTSNNVPEDESNQDVHGWDPWRHTEWWKKKFGTDR